MTNRYFQSFFALVLAAATIAPAQTGSTAKILPQPPTGGSTNVDVRPPAGYCNIEVSTWTDRQNYQEGTDVAIFARASADCWVYVYSTDAQGVTHQLFPNGYDSNNFVRAGTTTRLPSNRYRLVASGAGWDTIQVIAVSGGTGWQPPPRFTRFESGQPFPVYRGGVKEAREDLQKALPPAALRNDTGTEKKAPEGDGTGTGDSKRRFPAIGNDLNGGIVDGPGEGERTTIPGRGGCWGEASTQIYVYPVTGSPSNPTYPGNPSYPYPGNPYYPNPGQPTWDDHQGKTGTLRVTTSPSRADVFVNGYYQGQTPLTVELPKGYYDITVRKDNYEPYGKQVGINEGKRTSLQLRLKR